ncbi:hypothetical protein HMPREF1567_1058 [Providencia alcalifaciens PAL-2]|nr:hypothetical protein HMPREF1562_1214 [Providencia alcalifaciens F90-2004]EUC94644.1 hypothetical protein HMPREF1567_1058 [Providencia alcalifaciens PAL-2]
MLFIVSQTIHENLQLNEYITEYRLFIFVEIHHYRLHR